MKKIQSKYIVIAVTVILIVAAVVLALVLSNKDEKMKDPTPPANNETVKKDDVYLILSINPKVMLRINNDKIIEVYQLNDDAVVFTNKELQGLGLEDGVKKIIDIATKNDYLKEDTEIRMSVWEYKNKDEEESTKILEAVQTNFLENGIHIKPYIIEESETKEILEILDDYVEKTQDIPVATPTPEPTTTPEPTSTLKPSKTPTSTNPSTPSPIPESINLDISKVKLKRFSSSYYIKLAWKNELNYPTQRAYFQDMSTKCDNGTLSDAYSWLSKDTFEQTFPNNSYYTLNETTANICKWVKEINSKMVNDYLYPASTEFAFYDDGIRIFYDTVDYADVGWSYCLSNCGERPVPVISTNFTTASHWNDYSSQSLVGYKLTSDKEKYYLEMYNVRNIRGDVVGTVKCTSGTDLVFTCDKALSIDEYTGKGIYTFRP